MPQKDKRIFRSAKNRVFLGVAGGLAEYFEIDPLLIRVIFIVLTFFSGLGIIFYIVLVILIPAEKPTKFEENIKGFARDIKDRAIELVKEVKKEFKPKRKK